MFIFGLDDYFCVLYLLDDERYVDLCCWMVFVVGLMVDIVEVVDEKLDVGLYKLMSQYLLDNRLLDEYYWFLKVEMYSDFGNYIKFVKFVQCVMYLN